MTQLRFRDLRWTLVSEQDALEGAPAAGSLDEGYRHAAAAQSVYFQPGSLAEFCGLAAALGALNEPFPTVAQVRAVLAARVRPLRHYALESDGELWWLRNRSSANFASPFLGRNARLFIETERGLRSYPLPSDGVLPALGLLEQLSGECGMEALLERSEHPEALALAGRWLADGLFAPAAGSANNAALPELLFLGHSSIAVRSGGTLVVVDPVCLPGNARIKRPEGALLSLLRAADYVVISHHHWDHLHFQTLCRLPRTKPILVPRSRAPGFSNPPVAAYLRALGFSDVREVGPGERHKLGEVTLRTFEFYGEPFGRGSTFDAFTYHFAFADHTLYGSVDACFNEVGDMEQTISKVAALGPLDFFLVGSSGQVHARPYQAAGQRHFSNELRETPTLIRYHPTVTDAERWARVLKPRVLMPYAQFLFRAYPAKDLELSEVLAGRAPDPRGTESATHCRWLQEFFEASRRVGTPLLRLQPQQGVRLGS